MSTHDYADDVSQHSYDSTRPHSIDFSIALEHQLEIDSLPNSPTVARHAQDHSQPLDPQVLASIVTQLRQSLEEVTKERDDLSDLLVEVQARETDLKDALHTVSERSLRLEGELASLTDKSREDQDAVAMLRSKLEDSRRALMRLQTESRRSSMALDLSRAGPSSLTGPPSSRRSSFAPLTGSPAARINAHRRISSVSEPGVSYDGSQWGSPPNTARLEPLQLGTAPPPAPPASNSRRISGLFGRTTPTPPELPPMADASEVEELQKELQAVKEQLEETRHELIEARESQEASETCASALRTFIAENSIGMHPPGREVHSAPATESSGRNNTSTRWGFKLWNASSTASTPATSPSIQNAPAPSAISAAPPLTRKIGGFFSSRSSISSTSTSSALRPDPHSQQQEPMFNGSDASSVDSVTEPVSPASEVPSSIILVQSFDGTQAELAHSPEHIKRVLEPVDLDNRLGSSDC